MQLVGSHRRNQGNVIILIRGHDHDFSCRAQYSPKLSKHLLRTFQMLDHAATDHHLELLGPEGKLTEIASYAERSVMVVCVENRLQVDAHYPGSARELPAELHVAAASGIQQALSWTKVSPNQVPVQVIVKLPTRIV